MSSLTPSTDTFADNTPALRVSGFDYHYVDKQVLSDVCLDINKGSFTALLGPNGAGKTTIFSAIAGLVQVPREKIFIQQHDIRIQPGPALEHLGIVFQQPTLDLGLSVNQNLHYFAALRGMSRKHAARRIADEVERLSIGDVLQKPVRQLNGGHRRRVEIARSLLHHPSLLLLDEPTVGLDVPTRRQFVDYAHTLARERNVSVLWATHLIDEVDIEHDDLAIIEGGKIQAQGSALEVIEQAGDSTLAYAYQHFTGDAQQ